MKKEEEKRERERAREKGMEGDRDGGREEGRIYAIDVIYIDGNNKLCLTNIPQRYHGSAKG